MNKNIQKLFIALFLATLAVAPISFAQDATSSINPTSTQIEISLPVQKDDFLLFYGTTKDKDVNDKLDSLRKDFMVKFQVLKEDYKKSITETISDNELVSPIALDSKDINKVLTQVKKIDAKVQAVKKYSIKNDKDISIPVEAIISPIVNAIDVSSTIHTENSSWFHKIKAIFNW
ncbi:MAG: hypothetical protein KBD12_01870 [Candidatus Pacebacteria bacterium]|nr:hypothetical protein [Candidatus Paceibacterota bacterium]